MEIATITKPMHVHTCMHHDNQGIYKCIIDVDDPLLIVRHCFCFEMKKKSTGIYAFYIMTKLQKKV